MPIRWGGLGVRGVVLLAPSAYLASAASTMELTSTILPARLRDIKDSGVDAALAAWTSQAANPIEMSAPSPPSSTVQRVWDDHCCKIQHVSLLKATSEPVDRARLLASCSQGSGDWLHALPLSSVGLKLDNATVRISARLRSEHRLFVLTPASAEQWSLLMVTMVSHVVVVPVVIRGTIK